MVKGGLEMKVKKSIGEKTFYAVNTILLVLIAFITLTPFLMIIAGSFSDISSVVKNEVFLIPKNFTLAGYVSIFEDNQIFQAYYNTIWYTLVGTSINLLITLPAAYALSRKRYCLKNGVMFFFSFTMFFSGGMVPSYLLIQWLGLYNTRWAMVLPGAVSVFNLVMARTFFSSNIPEELAESARIDGANDIQIFFVIVLPLAKAIIAVLALYYGVGHWNAFFNALIYLKDQKYMPLSLYLRRLLILGSANYGSSALSESLVEQDPVAIMGLTQRMKYCTIVVTMLPIMLVYPFFQRYFAKGVMVGSLKA